MSAESDALWYEAEAKWAEARERKVAELEAKMESRALVLMADKVVSARKLETMRAEQVLAQAIERARRARNDLDDAVTLLEQALRGIRDGAD